MTIEQKIISIIIALSFLFIILELVRRRRLKEEYSWLWVLISVIILLLASSNTLLFFIMKVFKAKAATSIVYMFGIMFLLAINLHFSVTVSNLKSRIKDLTQKISLLEAELEEAQAK